MKDRKRSLKQESESESGLSDLPFTADDLLTIEDVAALLKVPKSWIYAHTRQKSRLKLPYMKLGKYIRFSQVAIREFIHRLRREPHA